MECKNLFKSEENWDLIIKENNIYCIALQETKFPSLYPLGIKGFKSYFKNNIEPRNASLVKNGYRSEPLNINTNPQAIAITIAFPKKLPYLQH